MYIIIGTTFNILYILVYLTNAHALLTTVIFFKKLKTDTPKKKKKKVYDFTRKTARVSNIG